MGGWGVRRPGGQCKEVHTIEDMEAFLFFEFSILAGEALWPFQINKPTFFFQGQVDVRDVVRVQMVKAYASSDESDENLI